METTFSVPKIRCEGCASTIQQTLGQVPGVVALRVAVAAKEVWVDYDPARVDQAGLRQALAGAGFPAA